MNFNTLFEAIKITPKLDTLKLLKISDEEYFGDGYKDYISNSRLGRLIKKKDKNGNITGGFEDFMQGASSGEFNPSFQLGTAVHTLCLQPEYFMLTPPLDRPSAKAGMIADIIYSYPDHLATNERIKDASKKVDYYKGKPTPARINEVKAKMAAYLIKREQWESTREETNKEIEYLDNNSLEIANGCINAINNNQGIQNLLHPTSDYDSDEFLPSENEQAIIVECEVEAKGLDPFIIKLKSKLDNYTIDKDNNIITINDIKTTSKDIEYFGNVINYYNYNRELSMYSTLLKMVVEKEEGMKDPEIQGNFLIVKTFPPYDTGIYNMTEELFNKGGLQFQYLLRLAAIAIHFKDYDKYLNYLHSINDDVSTEEATL